MKTTTLTLFFFFISLIVFAQKPDEKQVINNFMDAWHKAAATADSEGFFGRMTEDAIYIGTDASERWLRDELKEWSKKYFERESAWAFTPLKREVYFDGKKKTAWFEENLDTWMGVCRGSGVLSKTKEGWKLKHYVLSVTIANDLIDEFKGLASLLPEKEVIAVIKNLFKGMKDKNGDMVRNTFAKNAHLMTTGVKDGKSKIKEDNLEEFIKFIETPSDKIYDERILEYDVKIDGTMATAWTPYEFYIGDQFSHCGVNAFQFYKSDEGWKIVQIIDTRRKEGCK